MGVIGSLAAELASGIGVTDCAVQSEKEEMSHTPIARQPTTIIKSALRTPKRVGVHSALGSTGSLSLEFTLPLILMLVLKYGRRLVMAVDFSAAWQGYKRKHGHVGTRQRSRKSRPPLDN
jgi:hypothetical protein